MILLAGNKHTIQKLECSLVLFTPQNTRSDPIVKVTTLALPQTQTPLEHLPRPSELVTNLPVIH